MDAKSDQQLYDEAVRRHRAGRLGEAANLYRQILAREPTHADAMHMLGLVSHQRGDQATAADLIRRSTVINPNSATAFTNLGIALTASGRTAEAINAYRQAIAIKLDLPEAHNNLGNALKDTGNTAEAIEEFSKAIALRPSYPEAHTNLGNALRDSGKLPEAVESHRQAIALRPTYAEAYNNLGNTLRENHRPAEAIQALEKAISLNGNLHGAHNNLGNALKDMGRLDEAIAAYRKGIELRPKFPEALSNLGEALKAAGKIDEAIAACREAIAINPNYAEAHSNLGIALAEIGLLDEAIDEFRLATELRTDFAEAFNNLGNALKTRGDLDGAIGAYRAAVMLRPEVATGHSNLIFSMLYDAKNDAKAIAAETAEWDRRYGQPLASSILPHENDCEPDRKLRIGYVSPDFRKHVVGQNLLPLFNHHNRGEFEIFCYAQVAAPDAMTARFEKMADHWLSIVGMTDEEAAARIRKDRIDILVDLAMHSGDNRLLVFARKPAPVQVCCFAYPGTTGLSAMDYRLTDPHLDPPGMFDEFYSEKSVRLADSWWCYEPLEEAQGREPAVGLLPAIGNGFVTFGCLNNYCKISDQTLDLWARVLQKVPTARVMLMPPRGMARSELVKKMEARGVAASRLEMADHQPRLKYLELYNRIDIGLDTLPYGGHTTSLDSYWMGVPIVTLAGSTVVGRAGLSQSRNLGLGELAGENEVDFIRIAVNLAGDINRLSTLRSEMRERMRRSPLMDGAGFARNIEAAFRQMWRNWCLSIAK